jgi:AcrR family transcriptional regulator
MKRNPARREETRASLLDAAARCFAGQGYDATGVAEICDCAGVSKGAFYYHFASKQAIFIALAEAWLVELDESLNSAGYVEGSAPDRLLAMSAKFQELLESQQERLALILEFWAQASRNPAIQQVVLAPYRSFQDFFVGLIGDGIAEGSFRPIDAVAGGQVMLSLASGLFFQGLLDPMGADWSSTTEKCLRILLDGMRSDK